MRVKSPPRQLAHYDLRQVALKTPRPIWFKTSRPHPQDKSPTNLKRSCSHKISSSSTVYLNTKINFLKKYTKINIFNSYLIHFTHRKRTIIHERVFLNPFSARATYLSFGGWLPKGHICRLGVDCQTTYLSFNWFFFSCSQVSAQSIKLYLCIHFL
jgi:hypothetical protein